MFEKIRKPGRGHDFKKWINYSIFGFMCLLFAFIGLGNRGAGVSGAGTAATVNGSIIPARDFQEAIRQLENRQGNEHGMSDAQRQSEVKQTEMRAMQTLVHSELLYQAATRAEIFATVGAIRDLIVNVPIFQNNGRFDREYYDRFLQNEQTSAGDFERKIGHDIVLNQLNKIIVSAWSPSGLVDRLTDEARNTKADFQFIKIDTDGIAQSTVTAKDVGAFLAKPENQLRVKADYQSNIQEYQPQEMVRARHILIKGDSAQALSKIENIKKQVTTHNFAAMAKKYSEDEGTKSKGGELGEFGRHTMVKEFEDAAFAAKPNTVVGPIKSPFGYHLILVESHKTTPAKPYAEVERQIAKRMIADTKKDAIAAEFAKAVKHPSILDADLAQYHLKWQDGGSVTGGDSYMAKLGLGDEGVLAVLQTPPGHIYGDLLRSGPNAYLVKTTKLAVVDSNPSLEGQMASFRKYETGNDILELWVMNLTKNASIHINQMFLK